MYKILKRQTNALQCMNVILWDSNHQHVSVTHVVFRVVRTVHVQLWCVQINSQLKIMILLNSWLKKYCVDRNKILKDKKLYTEYSVLDDARRRYMQWIMIQVSKQDKNGCLYHQLVSWSCSHAAGWCHHWVYPDLVLDVGGRLRRSCHDVILSPKAVVSECLSGPLFVHIHHMVRNF
jgi:hypothetical protein